MSRRSSEEYMVSGQYLLEYGEWVPLADYPGYYICREGFISKNGRLLKLHRGDRAGHFNVRLRKNGKTHEEYVHRLVARTFIRNPNKYPIVRHVDDDRYNNDANNLAWGTQKDNHLDAVRNGTFKPVSDEARQKGIELTRRPITAINLETGKEKKYRSINDAVRDLGVQQANVCKVLAGTRKHTCGYSFHYDEKDGDDA